MVVRLVGAARSVPATSQSASGSSHETSHDDLAGIEAAGGGGVVVGWWGGCGVLCVVVLVGDTLRS